MTARWVDVDGPSAPHVLSYSSAKVLIQKSPLHAWLRKRRETPEEESESEREDKETGNILHAMLLGKGRRIVVLPFDDYRTKAAKESRDKARAEGAIPVKHNREPWLTAQAQRIRRAIEVFGIGLDGEREAGVTWIEPTDDGDDVECLGALDLWQPRTGTIFDLKFVKSAHPEAIKRQMISMGYDIQAAAYRSAVEQIEPQHQGRVRFVFLFCEVSTAAVTPVEPAGSMRALGESRWRRAVNTWARCLREDHWPGYVERVTTVDAPPWALEQEMMAASDATAAAWESRLAPTQRDEQEDDDASRGDDIPFRAHEGEA